MYTVLWICYMVIVTSIFLLVLSNLIRLLKTTGNMHMVEKLHFNSCKVRGCVSHFYPEMQLHTYNTSIQVGDGIIGVTDNYDIFKACKKYDKERVEADIDVCIYSNGTSKIIVKEIAGNKFNEEVVFDGKYPKQ